MQTPSTHRVKPVYQSKKDKSYNSIVLMIAIFFVGFAWCVAFYPYTLISITSFSKFLIFFGVIGFLIPLKFYARWFHFAKYEVILLNIMGIAPFATGMLLLTNYYVNTSSFTHYYSAKIYYENGAEQLDIVGFNVERNFFSKNYKFTGIEYPTENDFANRKFTETKIYNGLFGLKVIKDEKIVYYK